ncbi:MAG: FecR domain-containing protein [Pyrinomonadaceae bacterium]
MKRLLVGFVGFALLAIISSSPAISQNRTLSSVAGDKWVITAKAGGVNYAQGTVNVTRLVGKSGLLMKGDTVDVGDQVATEADGRVEILLNPGSYLRVAENSAFEFKTTQLEDLEVLVTRGSVMLEVFADNDFKVAVGTPMHRYDLMESGVYRVDVATDGNARIEVWKGKAEVGDAILRGGKSASSLDGQMAVAKFDRDDRDNFETWSRDRAKELAKGTNALKDRTLRTSLMRSFLGGRWNMYNSFGLWVYDAQFGRYCFLPFGYGWSSPYGYGFGTDIWWYRLPQAAFYPPMRAGSGSGTPQTGSTNTPAGTPPRQNLPAGTPPGDRRPIVGRKREPIGNTEANIPPPFIRMQGNGRGTGGELGGSDNSSRGVNPRSSSNGDFGRSTPSNTRTFEPSPRLPSVSPRSEPSSGGRERVPIIRENGDN